MKECLGESDVKELASSMLAQFDQEVGSLPEVLCVSFNRAASRLEAQLLTIYRVVVQIVRKEDDLGRIAAWWGTMVAECDEFAKRLGRLARSHPECGVNTFYDRVLDLRNKCERLRQMHA